MNLKRRWKWVLLPLLAGGACLQASCILSIAAGMIGVVQANQALAPFFDSLGF
jgi:hypothetical protein